MSQTSQASQCGKRRTSRTSPSDLVPNGISCTSCCPQNSIKTKITRPTRFCLYQGHDQHPVRHPFRSVDRRRGLQHDGRRWRRDHDLCRREAVGGQPAADRLQDTAEGVGIALTAVRITSLWQRCICFAIRILPVNGADVVRSRIWSGPMEE